MPEPVRLRAAERREQLLDIALRLIDSGGFAAVTMEAVARNAGVTRPVVYKHFPDARALTRALLIREEQGALAQVAEAMPVSPPGDADPDALLVEGIGRMLEAVKAHPERWRLFLRPPQGAPPQIREHLSVNRSAALRQLEQLVEWGIERRGGPREVDAELMARLILNGVESTALVVIAEPDRFPVERITRFVASLVAALPRSQG